MNYLIKTQVMSEQQNEAVLDILNNNTYFLNRIKFNEDFEKIIKSMKIQLKQLGNNPKSVSAVADFIQQPNGLACLLGMIGISEEMLERTLFFVKNQKQSKLKELVNMENWDNETAKHDTIERNICKDDKMAEGITKLLLYGKDDQTLKNKIPSFELNKFTIEKLDFQMDSLLDTILRYKMKGRYNASAENNAEKIIEEILKRKKINWTRGKVTGISRTMDFIIPNSKNPKMLIEVSYQTTTSSSMGDKAKNELNVRLELQKIYPNCLFAGFIDGAGWIFRKNDLSKLVKAFDKTFTFNSKHLHSFELYLEKNVPKECYYENTTE